MKKHATLPFTVVLTGGIASGKSTVSEKFEGLGVPVIDTDIIARDMVSPGGSAIRAIANQFGSEFVLPDGQLDRKLMRQAVFEHADLRKQLEAILHPLIYDEARRRLAEIDYEYCILVIPLFAESLRYDWVNRVLVVDVPESTQLERVMRRDGIDRVQAEAILEAQVNRERRLALADDVIVNTGSLEKIEIEVARLHRLYLELAKKWRD